MAPLLVNVLSVGPLAGGASITLPHGLNYGGQGVIPTQALCDKASPIGVTGTTTSTVTFTNGGGTPASANFRCEYDHSIHAVGATPLNWQGFVTSGTGQTVYGSFSDNTDQPLIAGTPRTVNFNTTELSNGVTVANDGLGNPTRLTVSTNGIYSFSISPQLLHTGGGGVIITFWGAIDGTNIPDSASSLEMGNNNNRTLPFIELLTPMNAGQYFEWYFQSTGTNTSLEHYAAVVGPPAIPAIPSAIANVKRISDLP
jgi:hypothetical protein